MGFAVGGSARECGGSQGPVPAGGGLIVKGLSALNRIRMVLSLQREEATNNRPPIEF